MGALRICVSMITEVREGGSGEEEGEGGKEEIGEEEMERERLGGRDGGKMDGEKRIGQGERESESERTWSKKGVKITVEHE